MRDKYATVEHLEEELDKGVEGNSRRKILADFIFPLVEQLILLERKGITAETNEETRRV